MCEAAHDDVDQLPPADRGRDAPPSGPTIVDEANERFAAMLDDLEPLAPGGRGRRDRRRVDRRLADLPRRPGRPTPTRCARDPEARLLVTAKDREQVTEYIDAFAADNRMPACGTPIDV